MGREVGEWMGGGEWCGGAVEWRVGGWSDGVVVGWGGDNREEGACGALQCTVRKSVGPIQKIRKGI